ncbi:MAG: TAXI family TRAP transporter solute-binding subunit [Nitrososphaerales archaeon]
MQSSNKRGKGFKWMLIAGIVIVGAGILFAAYFSSQPTTPTPATQPMPTPTPATQPTPTPATPAIPKIDPFKVFRIVSSGPTDPVWNSAGEELKQLIRKNVHGSSVDSMPGTAVININKITEETREAECGFTYSFLAKAAMKGVEPFKEKRTTFAGAANLYEQGLHFIVRADAPMDSIADLKGKKIKLATGPEPDIDELLTRWLLSEYGISYSDIESAGGSVENFYFDLGLVKLQEGSIDAISYFAPVGSKELMQFFEENSLRILPVDGDVIKSLESKRDLSATVIPAGTYKGVIENVRIVGSNAILVCSTELPRDVVETVTRIMMQNRDLFTMDRPEMSSLKPETAGKDLGIPLHQGAEAYYNSIDFVPEVIGSGY